MKGNKRTRKGCWKKLQSQFKPHEMNECAYFSSKTCDKCRANGQYRLSIGGVVKVVYCGRLAADLMNAMAQMKTAEIDVAKIEKLLRVHEQKLEKDKIDFIGGH